MVRKDLLKRAWRNNFLRKSVNDLKATPKAQPKPRNASALDLTTQHEAAPVLPSPQTSTRNFPTCEGTMLEEDAGTNLPTSPVSAIDLAATSQTNQRRHEGGVTEWIQSVNHGDDAMRMSSSEIRRHMDLNDAERKAKRRSAYFLSGYKMMSECRNLAIEAEAMTASHLDTIDTALAILEAMDALSPHTEALRQEMLEKKQICENKLIDLLLVRARLEESNGGQGYA